MMATPALAIGSNQDPVTPFEWQKVIGEYIGGSHLTKLKCEGHSGYGGGSACIDDLVDNYLLQNLFPFKEELCKN